MSSSHDKWLLLDTHIWIWLMNGDQQALPQAVLEAIDQASQGGRVGIAAISIWEIGMLEAKGKIRLNKRCLDWVQEALDAPGVHLLPLTPEVAVESSRLPGNFHGDPADRILAATARLLGATFVTKDLKLLEYGNQGFFAVMPAI